MSCVIFYYGGECRICRYFTSKLDVASLKSSISTLKYQFKVFIWCNIWNFTHNFRSQDTTPTEDYVDGGMTESVSQLETEDDVDMGARLLMLQFSIDQMALEVTFDINSSGVVPTILCS